MVIHCLFFKYLGGKININTFSLDDYNERLDKHIKEALENIIHPSHPCEYQGKKCFKGSSCPLIGLPNDTCIFYIRGTCKRERGPIQCRQRHYENYANVYQKAKEQFKLKERKPVPQVKHFLKRFSPLTIALYTIVSNYAIEECLII